MEKLIYTILFLSILIVSCSKNDNNLEDFKEENARVKVKLPEPSKPTTYSIYTWEEDKENKEFIILGANLFDATSIVIGNERFDAVSSDDGTSVKAILDREIETKTQPIWLNFSNKTARLKERYIPNKSDLPDYTNVSLTDSLLVAEVFQNEFSCAIDPETEDHIIMEGILNNYETRTTSPTISIGNSIIPIEQFVIQGDTLKGYITASQAENLENGLPIMFDGGAGFKKVADLRFQFPE